MSVSAWGIDHGSDISKGIRSDEPKYRGAMYTPVDGKSEVNSVAFRDTGKRSLIRRRPKYNFNVYSDGYTGLTAYTPGKPTRDAAKQMNSMVRSGAAEAKRGGVTYRRVTD